MTRHLALPIIACCALFSPSVSNAAGTGTKLTAKQDVSWKHYFNRDAKYCIGYPNRWLREQTPDGSGFTLATGVNRFSMPVGEMDITVTRATDDAAHLIEAHLEGVKKFVRASNIELLEKREMVVSGASAVFTKDRYRDPLEKADWIEELVLARHNNALYRLEMVCRADHVSRFELMFLRFVHSLELDCNGKR